MFNNQKPNKNAVQLPSDEVRIGRDAFLALVKKNENVLEYVDQDWVLQNSQLYKEIVKAAVKKNRNSLEDVHEAWAVANPQWYYRIVQGVVKKNGNVLEYVNKAWALENLKSYYDIVQGLVKKNGNALEDVNEEWIVANPQWYYRIVQGVVKKNVNVLEYVNKDWALQNFEQYYDIVLALVKKNGNALKYVNKDWALQNFEQYYDIVLALVKKNGNALKYVNKDWALQNSEQYYKIVLAAVKKDGLSLYHVNLSITKYYKIVLAAVKQNGLALGAVHGKWALQNSEQYYEIALAAVNQNGLALGYVNEESVLANPQQYYEIVQAALTQNGFALEFVSEDSRNDIHIVISSLVAVNRKCSRKSSIINLYEKIKKMLSIPCEPSEGILLYLYILSNKNVSNNFKQALLIFFIKKFENSDNFTLYKNILECYLILSNDYKDAFLNDKLLENLSDDDSKELHMFLSVVDRSALENSELAKLLKNDDNHIIKNYLTKDTYNLKCIKNFNIYLFVVDYTKIINMMKNITLINNKMKHDDLIRLVLCYFTLEDLLALYNNKLEARLEVKYLNIDLEFHRPGGDISTGIQALVDAIKANNGSLRNTGKYDTCNPIFDLLEIDRKLCNKLIELIE